MMRWTISLTAAALVALVGTAAFAQIPNPRPEPASNAKSEVRDGGAATTDSARRADPRQPASPNLQVRGLVYGAAPASTQPPSPFDVFPRSEK
ncbi:MAG TPA: hypothetical protein VGX21_03445 [Methylomirabilota bacterium]|nr:hypothetical protein [Methylomirabilota bacterium]